MLFLLMMQWHVKGHENYNKKFILRHCHLNQLWWRMFDITVYLLCNFSSSVTVILEKELILLKNAVDPARKLNCLYCQWKVHSVYVDVSYVKYLTPSLCPLIAFLMIEPCTSISPMFGLYTQCVFFEVIQSLLHYSCVSDIQRCYYKLKVIFQVTIIHRYSWSWWTWYYLFGVSRYTGRWTHHW